MRKPEDQERIKDIIFQAKKGALSDKKTISKLEEQGYRITERTFYNYLKKIKDDINSVKQERQESAKELQLQLLEQDLEDKIHECQEEFIRKRDDDDVLDIHDKLVLRDSIIEARCQLVLLHNHIVANIDIETKSIAGSVNDRSIAQKDARYRAAERWYNIESGYSV